MQPFAIITYILIIVNVIVSIKGFRESSFLDRYSFRVDDVLVKKEYYRLVTAGFLHIGWMHLILNMIVLYLFSGVLNMLVLYLPTMSVDIYLGSLAFVIIYFAGLVGGNLLALFIHRLHGDYSAVGASGAVCGIIFASIALFPGLQVGLLLLPFKVPGWLFGFVYIVYSIYGIRSQIDNIGHEAHLGGALVGMYTAIACYPHVALSNFVTIAVITGPAILFIYIIVTRPHVLFVDNFYFKHHHNATIDDRYNLAKRTEQKEVDDILEKIHQKGINSLSKIEKEKLDNYSKGR